MKYIVSILFISIFSLSNQSWGVTERIELSVWAMGEEGKKIRVIADQFEKLYPSVKVTTQAIPWSAAHEKIMTSVISEMPPDICQLGTTWMAEFATIGALESLDNYFGNLLDLTAKDFFKGPFQTTKIAGRIYGIPWYVDTRVLYYRSDLLKKANMPPPTTWDELYLTAKNLKNRTHNMSNKISGIKLSTNDWLEFLIFYWQNEGKLINDELTYASIDFNIFKETMLFYKRFFDEEITLKTAPSSLELLLAFKDGSIPMFISGPWMISELINKLPDLKGNWKVAPLFGHKNRNSFVGGSNLVTFKNSKQKQWALRFLSFINKPEIQAKWYTLTNDLPAVKKAWDKEELKDNMYLDAFHKQLESTQSPPPHPSWEQMASLIAKVQEQIILNKITIDDGYQQLERDLNLILSQNKSSEQSKSFKIIVFISFFLLIVLLLYWFFRHTNKTFESQSISPTHAILFLTPALILLITFLFIPIFFTIIISFTDWNIYSLNDLRNLTFIGFKNYSQLLQTDMVFWRSVLNTIIFVIVGVPLTILVSLVAALILNIGVLKFKSLFRIGYFIPVITTMVVAAVIWRWMYNANYGSINIMLKLLGLSAQDWLNNEYLALPSLIIMAVWKNFGYSMIIFLAGLNTIPYSLYEAAYMDGIKGIHRLLYITIPMLKSSLLFVTITTVIGYFQFFAEPYIMTEGGPNNATNSIVLYTYNHAFKFYNLGYASSISIILFLITLLVSIGQLWYSKRMET